MRRSTPGRATPIALLLAGGFLIGVGVGLADIDTPSSSEPPRLRQATAPPSATAAATAVAADTTPARTAADAIVAADAMQAASRPTATHTLDTAQRHAAMIEENPPAPTAVEIPAIGVRSELIELGIASDRTLEVPEDYALAGWFAGGFRPGQDGPAVIVGHVDSRDGPGVFWRLADLTPGDTVVVHRADGSSRRFIVDRLGRWPKDEFPTDAVYRESQGPELRLVTCGGDFDPQAARYVDNVVVFAKAQ